MLTVSDFDLRRSVESGQPLNFYADYDSKNGIESLTYVTTKGSFKLRCAGARIKTVRYDFTGDYSEREAKEEVARRFGFEDDLIGIYQRISTDPFMEEAVAALEGMRVTQNDPWETTLCFIISQYNNIKRIRLITKSLIERFGALERESGLRLFPTYERISKASDSGLRGCGTGFRTRYIKKTAKAFADGFDARALYKKRYADAKAELMQLDGVGDKVADCILLFAYKKLEAFPIDLWVKRTLEHVYFGDKRQGIKALHDFAAKRWGGCAGYAQQYLFQHARTKRIAKPR